MSPAKRYRSRRLVGLCGCALCVLALVAMGTQVLSRRSYRRLRTGATIQISDPAAEVTRGPSSSGQALIDFRALARENPHISAWVEVEGTDISLPVMSTSGVSSDFYLSHDFWDNPSASGVPFLDHRCRADATHRLVYGHHLTLGGQFSQLQKAHVQERFDELGYCIWQTPERGATVLAPLCALRVNEWYADIQRFSFRDDKELRQWLEALYRQATAQAKDGERTIRDARDVVTLVTCSSDLSHQPWRTLVVFVCTEPTIQEAGAFKEPAPSTGT